MNGTEFLADTNAVIYLLSGNKCMKHYLKSKLSVSVISFMELLSSPNISKDEDKTIRGFLSACDLLQIDDVIMEKTIELRRKYKKLK